MLAQTEQCCPFESDHRYRQRPPGFAGPPAMPASSRTLYSIPIAAAKARRVGA